MTGSLVTEEVDDIAVLLPVLFYVLENTGLPRIIS